MRRAIPIRLFAVVVAVGSVTAIPFAAPAFAATGASCTKLVSPPPALVGKVLTSKSTVSGCTPLAVTGGTGKSVTQIGVKVAGKVVELSTTTWSGGKGTTVSQLSYKSGTAAQLATCVKLVGKGALVVISTGKITGGSGAALKAIPKGSTETATVCVSSKSAASLYPGTTWKF